MKRIDIHVHSRYWPFPNRENKDYTYATADELIKMYDELNIEKGVLLPIPSPECRHGIVTNEQIFAIVKEYPNRFSWFCNVDPRNGQNSPTTNLSYYLKYYKDLGAKGVGEMIANIDIDDPLMFNLLKHCEKNDLPFLFHMAPQKGGFYGIIDSLGLPGLEKALAAFPDLKFIGHSQVFWAEIGDNVNEQNRCKYPKGPVNPGRIVELMRKYDNLYGDLSAGSGHNAVTRDESFGCDFLEEFNDRIFYGTDITSTYCMDYEFIKLGDWLEEMMNKGNISKKAYENIVRKNALKIIE